MSKKTNYTLRLILGMYLTFIGINLIRETVASQPSDFAFKIFMGIAFAVIGAGYVIWIIKRMVAFKKSEHEEQKREEAAEAALRKMEQRRERVMVQSRTAPMPSPAELEIGLKDIKAKSNTETVPSSKEPDQKESEMKTAKQTEATVKETIVKSSVSLDIGEDEETNENEETYYEEK